MPQELQLESNGKEKLTLLILTLITPHTYWADTYQTILSCMQQLHNQPENTVKFLNEQCLSD